MKVPFANLKAQYDSIKSEIDNAIFNCIENSTFIGGENVKFFEEAFAGFCEAQYCASCGNGTDGLEIALKSLGIKNGDEVIVPAVSFIATAEAVTNAGARIIFCDINPDTYCIDVSKIEGLINSKTKAIIPVHLYGQTAEMDELKFLADKYKLFLIEDAAQAHGARYKNKPVGFYSDVSVYSFYPGKNMGAYGDGGAMVTNNEELYKRMKMTTNHGRMSKYNHEFEGRSSRLDSLQAAILNVKLKYLTEWTEKRRKHAEYYNIQLKNISGVTIPFQNSDSYSVYHLYTIKVNADIRESLRTYLKEKNIDTGVHYPDALPFLPAYKHLNYRVEDFPVASQHVKEVASLPMFPEMTEEQIGYVCDSINEFFQ